MSKKNSNVILKNKFKDFEDLSKLYLNFKKKLSSFKQNKIVVAVSGGPDSLALTAFCKAYSYEKKINFYYVLVNHNIRKNSLSESIKVRLLLKKHNINLIILTVKDKITNNVQSKARFERYKLLEDYCKKKGVNAIFTAHNLEDQVETFFIRLSRGSGLTGLSSIQKVSALSREINLFRPLLDVRKKSLIKCSKLIFRKFISDPSNSNNKYLRTKIRSLKKPLKASGINYDQIIKSINNLASSKNTLDNFFTKIFANIVKKNKNRIIIDLPEFNKLNDELKLKTINKSIKYLKKNYYNPRAKKVLYLVKILKNKKFKKSTLGGCLFTKNGDSLTLKREKS